MSKICPSCDKELTAGKFCPDCGVELVTEAEARPFNENDSRLVDAIADKVVNRIAEREEALKKLKEIQENDATETEAETEAEPEAEPENKNAGGKTGSRFFRREK